MRRARREVRQARSGVGNNGSCRGGVMVLVFLVLMVARAGDAIKVGVGGWR